MNQTDLQIQLLWSLTHGQLFTQIEICNLILYTFDCENPSRRYTPMDQIIPKTQKKLGEDL